MLRIVAHVALLAGALALGACGFADSRAPVPDFMRLKEADQPPPEPPPDVKRVVREQIDVVFLNTVLSARGASRPAPSRGPRTGLDGLCPRATHLGHRLGARRPDLHRDDQRRKGHRQAARGSRGHLRVGSLRADLAMIAPHDDRFREKHVIFPERSPPPNLSPPRAVWRRTETRTFTDCTSGRCRALAGERREGCGSVHDQRIHQPRSHSGGPAGLR